MIEEKVSWKSLYINADKLASEICVIILFSNHFHAVAGDTCRPYLLYACFDIL